MDLRSILSNPSAYHYLRQVMTLGLPFREWVSKYGLDQKDVRVADIGCGPSDVLRYVHGSRGQAFYLGLDLSEVYLRSARARAAKAKLNAEFVQIDLARMPTDSGVRERVRSLLDQYAIDRVLLLGVIHHLDDAAVRQTLDLIFDTKVQSVVTQDITFLPGRPINNLFCRWDRGQHVRTSEQYEALFRTTKWPTFEKSFTTPGARNYQFIHYVLGRDTAARRSVE